MSPREEIIGDCRLILGDCREILPTLGKVDAVVTDPPYGISYKHRSGGAVLPRGRPTWNVPIARRSETIAGDDTPFDPADFLQWPCLLWGANHFADKLPAGRWLTWDKREGMPSNSFADCEHAWCSNSGPARLFNHLWNGICRASEKEPRLHTTQKPIAVMKWCLGFFPDAHTILDPFMGSGTTGVACVKLGRKFIGIEIEPKYFDIACRRIEQAMAQPDLFVETPKPAEQLNLLDAAQ